MLYTWVKFLHVVSAIVWVGGVIALSVLNARLARSRDANALAALSRVGGFYGQAVIGPAAALTLLAGIGTAVSGGFPMNSFWIIWGFAAILISVALGATLIRITTQQIGKLATGGDGPQIAALQGRLALLNGINILLLLSTVWAMIAKPAL
jgi:uncharacterized membrane protein